MYLSLLGPQIICIIGTTNYLLWMLDNQQHPEEKKRTTSRVEYINIHKTFDLNIVEDIYCSPKTSNYSTSLIFIYAYSS